MPYFHLHWLFAFLPRVLLVLSTFSSPALAQNKRPSKSPQERVAQRVVQDALKVDFELQVNALGISCGYPTAPEMGRRLCLLLEPERKQARESFGHLYGSVQSLAIHRLSELRGRVSITSPEAALSFVRLPTSPMTYFLLARREESGYNELEVTCRETDIPKIAFGLHQIEPGYPTLDKARTYGEGQYALISAATAKQMGIHFARVTSSGTGYRVERTLLVTTFTDTSAEHKALLAGKFDVDDEGKLLHQVHTRQDLIRTVEWVGADGEYRIEKNEKMSVPDTPGVEWRFPVWLYGR